MALPVAVHLQIEEVELRPAPAQCLGPVAQLAGQGAAVGGARAQVVGQGQVVASDVFAQHAVGAEAGGEARHAGAHLLHPGLRDAAGVAGVEGGHHLPLEDVEQGTGVTPVGLLGGQVATVAHRPAHRRVVGLRPPAIQHGTVEAAVHQQFHAAGAAGLPRAAGGVDPHVHPLHQVLGEGHVVVAEEDHARVHLRTAGKAGDGLHQGLAHLVLGVGLARHHQLHRPVGVVEEADEALRVGEEQVGAFVFGEAAGETEGEDVGVEDLGEGVDALRRFALDGQLPPQALAYVAHQADTRAGAQVPQVFVADLGDVPPHPFQLAHPAALAAGAGPQLVRLGGIPGGDVHTVGDVPHRHFPDRPAGETGVEQAPAHLPVQARDAVHAVAHRHGQPGHVEEAGLVPPQGQEVLHVEAQIGDEAAQVAAHQTRLETVESGRHGGVGGEQVAGAGGPQGLVEIHSVTAGVGADARQGGEGGVPLVEVAHLRFQIQGLQHPPAADAQDHLLEQTLLGPAAVQLGGDTPVHRAVDRVVAVQQVEIDPPHLHPPHTQGDLAPGKGHGDPQPVAGRGARRLHRHAGRLVEGVEGELLALRVQHLAEIALLVQQPHPHHGHPQVAGGLEGVAGEDAQAAGVQGQGFAQAELHGEIGHPLQAPLQARLVEPVGVFVVGLALLHQGLQLAEEVLVPGQLLQAAGGGGLQHQPGVVGGLPGVGLHPCPQGVAPVAPGPAHVQGQVQQRPQGLGQAWEKSGVHSGPPPCGGLSIAQRRGADMAGVNTLV